ncbi:PP208 [Orf virus]|uniref:PP208 n=1 Tax=Orf virus TaxID=10258 RepID=F1AX61_ORFV|nr:PP208 [Orf virus]
MASSRSPRRTASPRACAWTRTASSARSRTSRTPSGTRSRAKYRAGTGSGARPCGPWASACGPCSCWSWRSLRAMTASRPWPALWRRCAACVRASSSNPSAWTGPSRRPLSWWSTSRARCRRSQRAWCSSTRAERSPSATSRSSATTRWTRPRT